MAGKVPATQPLLYDCAPSARQVLLLRAALEAGETALQAWEQWSENGDLDRVDSASFRLLPLVYRNLSTLGAEVPQLQRLKIIYRHSWFRNQTQFAQVRRLIGELNRAAIDCMLLKGAALTLGHYRDDGVRYMYDTDLLVRGEDFDKAVLALAGAGWAPNGIKAGRLAYLRRQGYQHGWAFTQESAEVDLHAQLTRFTWQDDDLIWRTARSVPWRDCDVFIPSDTVSLYHCCLHGARWSEAKLSWIPDAMLLLKEADGKIDWNVLVELAVRSRTVCQLRNSLCYLALDWRAPVPSSVLEELYRCTTSWVERREFEVLARAQNRRISHLASRWYLRSCRYASQSAEAQGPLRPVILAPLKYLYLYALSGGAGEQ
jgi:hypothetical protein